MRWKGCLWIGVFVMAIGFVAAGETILVHPGDDIQAAIDGASAGDTIQLAAGTYDVAATIEIDKGIILEGAGSATVRGTSDAARNVFKITASDVTLQDLAITLSDTYALGGELEDCLIGIPNNAGLSGIVIQRNTLYWPDQAGSMSDWGGRAITIGSSGVTEVTISGNTVYNTRNGIVVRYGNTATITGNTVYNTKGGVMNYTSNQADADNRTVAGNSWGAVHNEWDIVWNSANYDPDYQASVIALSGQNNGAYVVDRRDAAGGHTTGNRSHVFVNATGTPVVHECNGNMNAPYSTLALGFDGVAAGGTIYLAAGDYKGLSLTRRFTSTARTLAGRSSRVAWPTRRRLRGTRRRSGWTLEPMER